MILTGLTNKNPYPDLWNILIFIIESDIMNEISIHFEIDY